MPIGSASIRRATGAMNKTEKKSEKVAFAVQTALADVAVEKISGVLPQASDALIKSVKKYGVMEPVSLLAEGEKFRIVSGACRIAAAKACGLEQVKAVVITLEGTGVTAAKKDLMAIYKLAVEEIAVAASESDSIHEEKFKAARSIGNDLPDYLL